MDQETGEKNVFDHKSCLDFIAGKGTSAGTVGFKADAQSNDLFSTATE